MNSLAYYRELEKTKSCRTATRSGILQAQWRTVCFSKQGASLPVPPCMPHVDKQIMLITYMVPGLGLCPTQCQIFVIT